MTEARRYVFAPLEHRGGLLGLRAGQVALIGGALLTASVVLRAAPDGAGVATAVGLVAAAAAVSFVPIGGQPAESWVPVAARYAARRGTGAATTRPRPGPVVLRPPPCFRGLDLLSVDRVADRPVAVVRDRSAATLTAVLSVRGRSFSLLDATDKERRLASWATILSGLSREGGPVRSLQWVQRTVPGDAEGLRRHFEASGVLPGDAAPARSYAELISGAGPAGADHESFVAVTIRDRKSRGTSALLRELRLLEGQLRSADLDVEHALSREELNAIIRTGFDPATRAALRRRSGPCGGSVECTPHAAWPAATDETWSSWRTDEMWHATFWIAEWPRTDVGADFLTPLLLQGGGHRTVSVHMVPLTPSAGMREAEAARTAQIADDDIRHRAGFVATARRRREADGIARREAELADGHAAYRFTGYVTVSAGDADALDVACGELIHATHQCRLDLRRLYGIQDVAFTWTLPLGRGIDTG